MTSFIEDALKIDEKSFEEERKLKILYFQLTQEINRMDKIKARVEQSFNFRINVLFYILWSLLVFQTAWFFYMIWFVDHLGWDLVEPATFLVSSSLFIISVFCYVKLNRNYVSSVRIFSDIKNRFELKRFTKLNFNINKYNDLQYQKQHVRELLEHTKYI